MEDYKPTLIPGANQDYLTGVSKMNDYAGRDVSEFQNDLNQGVKEQSNLMGPSDDQNPESQALNARANQMYQGQLANMTRNSIAPAMQRKMGLQSNAIDNQAAEYTNQQSRMAMQYQQTAFKRQAALTQAGIQSQLMNNIFQGVGFGGAWAAKGLVSAANPSPIETMGASPVTSNYAGNNFSGTEMDMSNYA